MKEKNNVFIGLAIFISFILLAAAVILIPVIKGMNPDWKAILVTGRKNLDTDSQISQNPLPLKSEEVISFSGFNELSITLKPGGQNKKTMVLSLKDGNWLDLENPDLDISQEKVSVILEELNNIKVLNRINNAKDNELKSFGFDYPRIQVQGKSNGNKIGGIAGYYQGNSKNLEYIEVENVEIKNRHKSLLDTKFKDDKTIFCDIANIDSNKGNAVKKLLEILNIKKEETIAIGDDMNDLSMFEQVEYKVAVDNAIDIVKENADEITSSNDEDGVAVFLNKLLENY